MAYTIWNSLTLCFRIWSYVSQEEEEERKKKEEKKMYGLNHSCLGAALFSEIQFPLKLFLSFLPESPHLHFHVTCTGLPSPLPLIFIFTSPGLLSSFIEYMNTCPTYTYKDCKFKSTYETCFKFAHSHLSWPYKTYLPNHENCCSWLSLFQNFAVLPYNLQHLSLLRCPNSSPWVPLTLNSFLQPILPWDMSWYYRLGRSASATSRC